MKLEHIKPLDGVRALAIFLVLLWHYFTCQIKENLFFGSAVYLKSATFWTWSGVDLFFVLSGFLIGRILIHHKASKNYFKTFYFRRIFRIFPPYYFILLIFLIILLSGLSGKIPWLTNNPHPFYSYLFYLQNFWMAVSGYGPHWLAVTWSLAIEEQFYLILPLIIYVVNLKSLSKFLILGIVLAPVFRAFIPGIAAYVLLPARMDSLLLGVLIAYYHLNGDLVKTFKEKQKTLLFFLIILFILIFICRITGKAGIGGIFIHSILALFYGTLIVLTLVMNNNSLFKVILSNTFMSFFAKISYMIYLTHQIFSGLFHQLILNQAPQINNYKDIMVTLSALSATILFSSISYYYFEKPIINLGQKYKF